MSGGRIDLWPPAGVGGLDLPGVEQLAVIVDRWLSHREILPADRWWDRRLWRSARLWSQEGLPLGRVAGWPSTGACLYSPDDVHWVVGARMMPNDPSTACWWAACGAGDVAIERCFEPTALPALSRWWLAVDRHAYDPPVIAPPVTCPTCLATQAEDRTGLEHYAMTPDLLEATEG